MSILSLLLLAIIPGLIISIVTAYITVKLSLRQFYTEKWWQEKAKTYSEILSALFHIKQYNAMLLTKIEGGIDSSSTDREKELSENSASGYETIRKVITYGSFVISDEASDYLSKFFKDISNIYYHPSEMFSEIEEKSRLIEICINQMRECAKRDLKKK